MSSSKQFYVDNTRTENFEQVAVDKHYIHIDVHTKPNFKQYFGKLKLKYINEQNMFFFLLYDDEGNERRFLSDQWNVHFLNPIYENDPLKEIVSQIKVPIIVICYNNHKYVNNMINKIIKINPDLKSSIIIMDNNSDNSSTQKYLQENINDVIIVHNVQNNGPWVDINRNWFLYDIMPDKFILTDPDLEINDNLPANFVDILCDLIDEYDCSKIGFALEVKDSDKMYDDYNYFDNKSIWQWETTHFWNEENRFEHPKYQLYKGGIDTTFGLVSKHRLHSGTDFINVRVAGDFTCRHLPFYVDDPLFTVYDRFVYKNKSIFSTMGAVYNRYIDNNFAQIQKGDEIILIPKDNKDISLWENDSVEEKRVFAMMDKLLNKDINLLIIGENLGKYTIYGSRKANQVYTLKVSEDVKKNVYNVSKYNCDNVCFIENANCNYKIANKIVEGYDADRTICVPFSDIINAEKSPELLDNILFNHIGMIIVDIKGKEQDFVKQFINARESRGDAFKNVQCYVVFDYSKWMNESKMI